MFISVYPMDCSPPGSSVHRILQARTWSGFRALLQGYSQPSGQTKSLMSTCIGRWVLYHHHHLGDPRIIILSSNFTSGKISKGNKVLSGGDMCTLMFTAALFTIVKIWKLVKCPRLDIHIRKM